MTRTVQGISVPSFFYGTAWKEDQTERLTRMALSCGFRAIDTANQRKHYFEQAVGDAIRDHDRATLFIQTKFTSRRGQDHRLPYDADASPAEQVAQSFARSLEHLGSTYVDSYVLHGPSHPFGLSNADREVWRAMEALHEQGVAKLLGASNMSDEQLVALCDFARVPPAFLQNRCFARTGWDREVRALCAERGVVYQGFSLLTANGRELASPAFSRIVDEVDATPAQIVFRFAQQVGMVPLTGTSSEAHMREDLACGDLALSDAQLRTIENLAS